MSFFEDASLVLIPSAQKTSKVYSVKPTDGTGDLTFTRSNDTATRVGPDGLIEKVRTNLILRSEAFDNASWTKSGVGTFTSAITTGFTDPTGGTNAQRWLATIASVSDRAFIRQLATLTNGAPYTISFWVKSNTASSQDIYFMFQGGAVQATTATTSWQRISYSATTSTTSVLVGIEAKDLAIDVLVYGFQLEVGDVMTDYIATTTAAVSVGPVANVPRLDYLNSSCPRLLLEGQRVNKWYFSESFDNAEWLKSNVTISANSAVSPDGYTNADKMVDTTANDEHRIRATTALFIITTATTFSIFAKAAEYSRFAIANLSTSEYVKFNLSTGAVISTGANFSNAKIENYGNGWYRLSATTSTSGTHGYGLLNDAGDFVFTGTGTKGVFIYGAMAEEAAYATSYIPTLGAAVTRGADAASKTGITSLIGQTEGTIFLDFELQTTNQDMVIMNIYDAATPANGIYFYVNGSNQLQAYSDNSGTQAAILSGVLTQGRYKAAFAYKANDFSFYLNGSLVGVDTSGTVPTCNALRLENYAATPTYQEKIPVNQALLFTTRLTNAQLAELTTI